MRKPAATQMPTTSPDPCASQPEAVALDRATACCRRSRGQYPPGQPHRDRPGRRPQRTAAHAASLPSSVGETRTGPGFSRTDQKWQPAGWIAPRPISGARKCDRCDKHSKHPLITDRDRFTQVVPEPFEVNDASCGNPASWAHGIPTTQAPPESDRQATPVCSTRCA